MNDNTAYRDLQEIIPGLEGFVMDREKADGGFGATPKLPATVEDTYHGLRIISAISGITGSSLWRETTQKDSIRAFLAGYMQGDLELGPRGIFQLLWCMKSCGILPENSTCHAILQRRVLHDCRRENLYFSIRATVEIIDREPGILETACSTGAGRPFSGILRLRMMDVYIDRQLNQHRIPPRQASEWFAACQNPDGGFGFMPGTTSYIENCHYGLAALAMLGSRPANSPACWQFIMGCRTKSGGFSRNSNAAPFLDATWHATRSLMFLNHS